jgi:tetratricopeptide (TPR) repeat protein
MKMRWSIATTSLLATFAAISAAHAQGGAAATNANECAPPFNQSVSLAQSGSALERAIQTYTQKGDPSKDLKEAIRWLTDSSVEKGASVKPDPLARDYVLAQAYIVLAQDPKFNRVVTRGETGSTTNPTGMIDPVVTADSLMQVVEKAMPSCVAFFKQFRHLPLWSNMINASITAMNAGNLDSATYYANRALLLDRGAPNAFQALALIEDKRKNPVGASDYFKKAIAAAQADTAYKNTIPQLTYQQAAILSSQAQNATGPDQKKYALEAAKAWQNYLPMATDESSIAIGYRNMTILYIMAGDTAAALQSLGPVLADPSKYGASTLANVGLELLKTFRKTAEATKILEAALQKDPYSHDALSLAIIGYVTMGAADKALPLLPRFLDLEPNNPETYTMGQAIYSVMMQKASKDKALEKVYTDSLSAYAAKAKMPVKVVGAGFNPASGKTSLTVRVENLGTAPADYNVTVEFIDQSGKAVTTKQASFKGVKAGTAMEETVTATEAGIVGYRFKPLPGI